MIEIDGEPEGTDVEALGNLETLGNEVSDEELEAAACTGNGGTPTIMFASYCFTCP
jgi:hypothetical protein